MKAFPLRSGKRQGCPLLPLSFNIALEVLAMAIREGKLSQFAGDMILYTENPKDATRKLLEFTSESGKVYTQKFLACLYINNEISEREIEEAISFTITSKRMKYLGISLHKKAKDLYSKNYEILMKETEDDTNR